MDDSNSEPVLQKMAVIWSHRRERDICVRIYYDLWQQDGCKIYTLNHVEEL